jgi:isopentenyl-diphosphate delta-isomerase
VHRLIDAVEADALIVHLNFLQEVVQPEGDVQAAGVLSAIEHLVKSVSVPVIAKETGAGMTRTTAQRLVAAGCAALDVGGLSGTTFAAVEKVRAERSASPRHAALGETFRDWGVPTPVALAEARLAGCEVVATGGIRGGLDVARAIAMGATCAGVASAVLRPASQGKRELKAFVEGMLEALRTALFLTGAETVGELSGRPAVVTGTTAAMMTALGHDVAALGAGRLR